MAFFLFSLNIDFFKQGLMTETKKLYLFACGLCLAIWAINLPYLNYAIYPLDLLATWSHEMGHGITAILTGGRFSHLVMYFNGSGAASFYASSDISKALTAAGGLLGPCVTGFVMVSLVKSEKSADLLLKGLSVILFLTVIFFVRNLSGIIIVLLLGALVYALVFLQGKWKIFAAQLLSAQLMLSPLSNWRYLFMDEAVINGRLMQSDVSRIASNDFLPLPYFVWGAIIAALTVYFFVLSLKKSVE